MLKTHLGDRLTVVEMVAYQQVGEEASQFDSRYSLACKTSDQVWDRKLTVGEEWQPLITKHCWVENPGMVIISNCAGSFTQVQPTEKEQAVEDAKILSVACDGYGICYIPPQGNMRFWPNHLSSLSICCRAGETKYNITVIPE